MILRIIEQRLNLQGAPCVPYRFFLTNSRKVHNFESGKNYRQIMKQDFSIPWSKKWKQKKRNGIPSNLHLYSILHGIFARL